MSFKWLRVSALIGIAGLMFGAQLGQAAETPQPLLSANKPVDWWFVFKFNSGSFPGCRAGAVRACLFGGTAQNYKAFGQQFIEASADDHSLKEGAGCAGDTVSDPVGATFNEVFNGSYFYALWNDQFYDDPEIEGCSEACKKPWGHSKGMLAWNDAGDGFVLQVTTPSWPAAGSAEFPRKTDGNTLGCIDDNNVKVSQHFFALKLTKEDLVKILKALQNASVATDPTNSQVVKNGGPPDVQKLVSGLGKKSVSSTFLITRLSTGVQVISKPSQLNVPPWQMVSALLGGVPLRTATWWARPKIYSTTVWTEIECWDDTLGDPGAVAIATSGQWDGKEIGLTGGPGTNNNHAKIGVSTDRNSNYAIFGDMNQQGTISGNKCDSSQNGRGGLFYVLDDKPLADGIRALIRGHTAPMRAPAS